LSTARDLSGAASIASLLLYSSCVLPAVIGEDLPPEVPPPPADECLLSRPVDLLFVVDNSGSMREEQQKLATAVTSAWNEESRCRGEELEELSKYARQNCHIPVSEWSVKRNAEIYSECGLVERLLALQNQFHIGVITTDMNDCDNPYGSGATRGSRPQRGCLQTSVEAPDLSVVTWQTPEPGRRLAQIISDVNIYGSAYERGLEAMLHFLTPDHDTPPATACAEPRDCAQDLDRFFRVVVQREAAREIETRLVLVFLTDEDDCSHGGAIDETVSGNTARCYDLASLVSPTRYANAVDAIKDMPQLVTPLVIAGLDGSDGAAEAIGCKSIGATVSHDCNPAQGNSVATCTVCVDEEPVCPCHPELTCPGGSVYPATNCCQADAASRYLDFGRAFSYARYGSICKPTYEAAVAALLDYDL